jgi:hypothetical protein
MKIRPTLRRAYLRFGFESRSSVTTHLSVYKQIFQEVFNERENSAMKGLIRWAFRHGNSPDSPPSISPIWFRTSIIGNNTFFCL